ncbi:MAG TPA: GGDEF domain-containing phosphodiesterase, partial [Clostridiaceae bacterium]
MNGGRLKIDIKSKMENSTKAIHLAFCLVLVALTAYIVYISGGTKHSLTHLIYIPTIMIAFVYGMKGSIFISLISGVIFGPFMPEDVKLGIMQEPFSWIGRTGIQLFIGIIVSMMVSHNRKLNDIIRNKAYENYNTGLPNVNKFVIDTEKHLKESASKSFAVLVFKYENMREVQRYIDFYIGKKSMQYLLDTAKSYFHSNTIYSFNINEFAVVLPEADMNLSYDCGNSFLSKFENLHYVDNMPIHFSLKCGVIGYPFHGDSSRGILQNIGKLMGQLELSKKSIEIYNCHISEMNSKNYHTLLGFLKGLESDSLTLHYQPKIDLKNKKVIGVEALLRWKEPDSSHVKIDELVKIVENAGMISQLTKWVVKKSVKQLGEWHKAGLKINVSANLSSRDLHNSDLLLYTKEYIDKYSVDPTYYEFELTERSLIGNEGTSVEYLNELKNLGLKISIDDYGTGCNSLINMVRMPVDCIKIDRYFINNMCREEGGTLVEDLISLIHHLGKRVLAEGVETIEQLKTLNDMDCDYVQGYYYSKPVPAVKVAEVISSIND